MQEYYQRRAQEYEQIYGRDDPVRQGEQAAIAEAMKRVFTNRRVLEVACGTGFWTEIVAQVAQHILAIDSSSEMLTIARGKGLDAHKVEFRQGDAYALNSVAGRFDAGLANFWFSHLPRARIDEFLRGFHERLGTGSIIFMADNVYMPEIGGELISRPNCQDTFKLRQLSDGSRYEVLKNYYEADQLHYIFSPRANNLKVHVGKCFWWLSYVVV